MSAPPDPADPADPAGRRRGLSVMATLQLIFLLQTAALMGYIEKECPLVLNLSNKNEISRGGEDYNIR